MKSNAALVLYIIGCAIVIAIGLTIGAIKVAAYWNIATGCVG